MSKPSIRTGTRSSPSASCSAESDSTRCWRRCSRRSLSWASASLAFFSASSRSRRRSPREATRTSTCESRWLESASASTSVRPRSSGPTMTRPGDRRGRAVVLEQEGLGDLAGVAVPLRARPPRPPGRSPAARPARRRGPGRPGRSRRLPSTATPITSALPSAPPATCWRSIIAPHGVQPVAEERRPLEVLRLGGLLHLVLEVAGDLLVAAREEADDPVDVAPVLLLVDVADAGRLAALDVVVEAGNAGAPAGLRALAGPVLEELAEQVERLADPLGARERPEVGAVRPVPLAGEVDAGKLLVEADPDVGIGLVVPQPDVEPRAVALDEALLREQGLRLVLA